jgi:hypothetical protein
LAVLVPVFPAVSVAFRLTLAGPRPKLFAGAFTPAQSLDAGEVALMSILWIALVVIVVLAVHGFFGRGRAW